MCGDAQNNAVLVGYVFSVQKLSCARFLLLQASGQRETGGGESLSLPIRCYCSYRTVCCVDSVVFFIMILLALSVVVVVVVMVVFRVAGTTWQMGSVKWTLISGISSTQARQIGELDVQKASE